MNKIVRFFEESYAELKKVTWPSREDVSASTRIVIISTALIAIALGLVDLVIFQAIELIF
jgi:preprotein translocase subunit SecE